MRIVESMVTAKDYSGFAQLDEFSKDLQRFSIVPTNYFGDRYTRAAMSNNIHHQLYLRAM